MSRSDSRETPAAEEAAGIAMRDEIVRILLEALRRQGHPDADSEAVRRDPGVRQAFLGLLDDCRPLPVVRQLRDDVAQGRF